MVDHAVADLAEDLAEAASAVAEAALAAVPVVVALVAPAVLEEVLIVHIITARVLVTVTIIVRASSDGGDPVITDMEAVDALAAFWVL